MSVCFATVSPLDEDDANADADADADATDAGADTDADAEADELVFLKSIDFCLGSVFFAFFFPILDRVALSRSSQISRVGMLTIDTVSRGF
jgi:hypothetical protein